LEIPETTYEVIEKQAEIRGLEPDQMVARWLSDILRWPPIVVEDPLEALIGTLECDKADVAEHHDQYIGQVLAKELCSG
jgi:hypothetical protein